MCENEHCEYYPHYGVSPHECYWRKPGGFDNALGTSTIEALEKWPKNFFAEIDGSQPVVDQLSYGLCGVCVCPSCLSGSDNVHGCWSVDKVKAAIQNELQPTA